jgi:hypothetical protein
MFVPISHTSAESHVTRQQSQCEKSEVDNNDMQSLMIGQDTAEEYGTALPTICEVLPILYCLVR